MKTRHYCQNLLHDSLLDLTLTVYKKCFFTLSLSKTSVFKYYNFCLDILSIVEHMKHGLEQCRKSLLNHLERRRQIFPRFFFLSMEDVLHIVCNGE